MNWSNIGLTPITSNNYSLKSFPQLNLQHTNHYFFSTPSLTVLLPTHRIPDFIFTTMGDLHLPDPSPGALLQMSASAVPDLTFTHFIDTRAIPYEEECSLDTVVRGSPIPGHGNLRYVCTHIHGRPSLSTTTIFARPAKNLASDLNGRPTLRPGGRGRAPLSRSASPSFRGRGARGGRRSSSPQDSNIQPATASFLAARFNMAVGSIQSTSKSVSPNQILFKAFDRNGLPDDTQLQQSGPTTFFIQLDVNSNPEAAAAICNSSSLLFPLHPSGRPLQHKSWVFENPFSSDIGPAVSENHTVYISFGVSPALTKDQIDNGTQPTPEIPLLWDCNDYLAKKKLDTVTLFLHMAAAADVDPDHQFYDISYTCQELIPLWHFSFVRLLGISRDKHPSLSLMDYFCLAAQASSLQTASSLVDFSPLHIPIVTDQGDMPLAVFSIYITLDNPTDSLSDESASSEVTAEEEQNFKNHSIQLSCQIPVDPEHLVNGWTSEILRRIKAHPSNASTAAAQGSSSNNLEDSILTELEGISNIDLYRVNISPTVQIPRPYKVNPNFTTANKTRFVTVAPINPRVVQFALSHRGSSRLQISLPSTSDHFSPPVTVFVGTAGVRLHPSTAPIPVPPSANKPRRTKAIRDMEAALNVQQHPTANQSAPGHQRPSSTFASLFHKPPTPPVAQPPAHAQQSNPLYLQSPTTMEHDAQDLAQVSHPYHSISLHYYDHARYIITHIHLNATISCTPYYHSNRLPFASNSLLNSSIKSNKIWPSNRLPFSSNSWLNNSTKASWKFNELQEKPICFNKSWKLPTKTERPLRPGWRPCKLPRTQGQRLISSSPVGPNLLLAPASQATEGLRDLTGAWRKNCTSTKRPLQMLNLPHAVLQAKQHQQLPHPTRLKPQLTLVPQPLTNNQLQLHHRHLQPTHEEVLPTTQYSNTSGPWTLIRPNISRLQPLAPSLYSSLPTHTPDERPLTVTLNITGVAHTADIDLPNQLPLGKTLNPLNPVLVPIDSDHLDKYSDSSHRNQQCTLCRKKGPPFKITPCPTLNLMNALTTELCNGKPDPPGSKTIQCNVINVILNIGTEAMNCIFCLIPHISHPSLLDEHKYYTLKPSAIAHQIKTIGKMVCQGFTSVLYYSTPTNLFDILLKKYQQLNSPPHEPLKLYGHTLLLKLLSLYTFISVIHQTICRLYIHKRRPQSRRYYYRCSPSHAPIKSLINTLPDRYGATILYPPHTPWPPRSILLPHWRPADPYAKHTNSAFIKVKKTKWKKFVQAKNKAYLGSLNVIIKIITTLIIPYQFYVCPTNAAPHFYSAEVEIYAKLYQISSNLLALTFYVSWLFISKILADPRTLLLLLLLCAGDIHPNPGPPNISQDLLNKYYSSTPTQFTIWIRRQNHQDLHFGDPNGQPYFTREDMLSGFHQEYLDKTDQTNLLSKILRQIYTSNPNISPTAVKIVRTAEEHDMQRGQTPLSWINTQQPTRALEERAAIMFDPLNCKALVIPRIANAHFTTYVIHPKGVAYYDSLFFPPDTALIAKYHEALKNFYILNPHTATPQIHQTLQNISRSPPVRMQCTKQTPERAPWSCGYCSANVCIQAVLQQAVPKINQPLKTIYEIQAAYLEYKITGNENIWESVIQTLQIPYPSTTPDTSISNPFNFTANQSNKPVNNNSEKPNKLPKNRLNKHSKHKKSNNPTNQKGVIANKQFKFKQATLDFKTIAKSSINSAPTLLNSNPNGLKTEQIPEKKQI